MKLQTKIPLEKQSNNLIDYNSNILLIGSCFSENIGNKLEYFKFQNLQNPFGILFHPKAIERLFENAISKKKYTKADVFFLNEQWHCFDGHSKLSKPSKDDLLNFLNEQLEITNTQIYNSSHVIVTLGTAWVYRNIDSNTIVANCHKVPQKQFDKELLSVELICQSLKNIIDLIQSKNPKVSVIFTVSPVRHLKDGFIENMQSKAHLIAAVHQLLSNSAESRNLNYFPSYEIMMDELRDYRFYNEDMIHPSELAINYIWEAFKTVWVSEEVSKIMDDVDYIQKGLQHKPFNQNSEAHIQFLEKLESRKQILASKLPHIKFS
ncbi:GSCFA domain-containing protein [uncultured Algibacter sp.]|uniref:GSCFA domain-containing protein n=1 Tax=uncultured Algibacter sp. TaxID=298659 RepID=UPI00263823D6|nr:GSCFA domain-containing protein [uncultured Algibacter sp.]